MSLFVFTAQRRILARILSYQWWFGIWINIRNFNKNIRWQSNVISVYKKKDMIIVIIK